MRLHVFKYPIIDRSTRFLCGRISMLVVDRWLDDYYAGMDSEDRRWELVYTPLPAEALGVLSSKLGRKVIEAHVDMRKVIVSLERRK